MASLFQRKDTGIWYVSYMLYGTRVKKKLGKNKRLAELAIKEIELKLERQELNLEQKDKATDEAFEEFVAEIEATKAEKTRVWYKQKVRTFLESVRKSKLSHYTPSDINKYKLKRLKKVSPGTVGGDLRAISVFFNFAIRRGYLKSNPCQPVEKPKNIPKNPPTFLNKDEIDRLLKAAEGNHLHSLIATALYSGLRKGELIWLEWEDINFKRDTITVRNKDGFHTKSYKSRTIPLNLTLKKILLDYRQKSGWCFPNTEGGQNRNNLLHNFKRLCTKAGIENCNLHTLRHTFASQLVIAGVSIYKVSRWLGHSDVKTTMIYAHLAPQDADINRI